MSIEGFDGNSTYNFQNGEPLSARALNEVAAKADTANFTQNNIAYTQGAFGTAMSIDIPYQDTSLFLQQFQILAEPYNVLGFEGFSIIRVVKGEVVWSPKLMEVPGVPMPVTCTTQTTIENWFDLPTFPIIDDDSSNFIGDGGIRVPNVSGVDIGIFVFKATMLPTDIDPIIVALADYVPSCPVVLPFSPPVEEAVWEVVKIGSVTYVNPDPEADPPVAGGWQITQNFIGSMTLPGSGQSSQVSEPFLPPQLPSTAVKKTRPAPFECRIDLDSSGDMLLKIGNGTVSYTQSNMPWVQTGAVSQKMQYQYTKVQVVPSGWRKEGEDAEDGWMEFGGGYKINGEGQWYLCACYWDVWSGPSLDLPTPVAGRKPFLALIDAYGDNVGKLFKETGPGLYTQTMNIQKMTGYDAASTEEFADWMHCHSTWFNPMKYGFDIKMIARIESKPADPATTQVFTMQTATENRNEIQNIYFPVLPKDGFVVFSYDGIPSAPFYPVPATDGYNSVDLFNALQQIPALQGNIMVTQTSEKNYYVTFINGLEKTNVSPLVAVSSFDSWDNEYVIDQYHTGNLILDTEPKFNGTQIMNKPGVTSEEDPYTIQSNASPAFDKVVNREDMLACDNLEVDVSFTGMFPVVDGQVPSSWTTHGVSQDYYFEANGCDGDTCEHPFQVNKYGTSGESATWKVCSGFVNNKEPSNKDDIITLQDGFIWLKCTASDTQAFPIAVTIESGTAVPADTNTAAYIVLARITAGESTQLLSGSVWADRIKVGTQTPNYYYAGV